MANRFICTDGEGDTDEIQSFTALDVKKAFVVNSLDLVRPGVGKEDSYSAGAEIAEDMTVFERSSAIGSENFTRTFGIL